MKRDKKHLGLVATICFLGFLIFSSQEKITEEKLYSVNDKQKALRNLMKNEDSNAIRITDIDRMSYITKKDTMSYWFDYTFGLRTD